MLLQSKSLDAGLVCDNGWNGFFVLQLKHRPSTRVFEIYDTRMQVVMLVYIDMKLVAVQIISAPAKLRSRQLQFASHFPVCMKNLCECCKRLEQ